MNYLIMLPYLQYNFGARAHRRLDGECVFGQGISVGPPLFPDSSAHRGYFVSQAPMYSNNSAWPSTNGSLPLRPMVFSGRNCSGYSGNYGSSGYVMNASGTDQYRRNLATLYSMQQASLPFGPVMRNATPQDESPSQTEFQPISNASYRRSTSPPTQENVELNITNLDQNIPKTEVNRMLHSLFAQHVTVLNVSLYAQGDGVYAANITVPTQQDAQVAIAKLQKVKIGQKRITIAYANSGNGSADMTTLTKQVTSLLQDVPSGRLPLIRFLDMFEARYGTSVSISELNRLKDLVTISLDSSGRILSLNVKHRHSPSFHQEVAVYCVKHFHMGDSAAWAEKEVPPLPNVMVPLKEFIDNIVKIIGSHRNALPLASVHHCYAAECNELPSGNGVPLEHLVTCCPSRVVLSQNSQGVRYLRWAESNGTTATPGSVSSRSPTPPLPPTLMSMLNTFSREIVDLLKCHPGCQLPFHKLIPAYHHHFRKQCRVSSYGFIRLIELLEAVPSVVQVLGEGEGRIVTLTHTAQVKRFYFDLCTIIKSQSSRSVTLSSLPHLYNQIIGVPLEPIKFGVCYVNDLIEEVTSHGGGITATVLHSGETILTLRQRNSVSRSSSSGTPSPVQADISAFISEVVELLGLEPCLSIKFTKFIPAYHHHFGYQCRVSDFGFTKLIELFEAIPHIVEIGGDEGDKKVTLTLPERVKVVAEQILTLAWRRYPMGLTLSALKWGYLWRYGTALKPVLYGAESLAHLVNILPTVKTKEDPRQGLMIIPVESEVKRLLGESLVHQLVSLPGGRAPLSSLISKYPQSLNSLICTPQAAASLAPNAIIVDLNSQLCLSPVYQQIKKLYEIVGENAEGKMTLAALKERLAAGSVDLCGHPSLASLIRAAGRPVLALRGKEPRLTVLIIREEPPDSALLYFASNSQEAQDLIPEDTGNHPNLRTPPNWSTPDAKRPVKIPPMPPLPTPPAVRYLNSVLTPTAPDPSLLPLPDLPAPEVQQQPSSSTKRRLKLAAQFAFPLW